MRLLLACHGSRWEEKMKTFITVTLLALCGCGTQSPQTADLARTQAAVSFGTVETPDMSGFNKHWSLGSQSAWYNMSTGEVLVLGPKETEALRISGFPQNYGHVVATGWEDGKRFFVHVSPGADTGTMIYCDLKNRKVIEVRRWGGW